MGKHRSVQWGGAQWGASLMDSRDPSPPLPPLIAHVREAEKRRQSQEYKPQQTLEKITTGTNLHLRRGENVKHKTIENYERRYPHCKRKKKFETAGGLGITTRVWAINDQLPSLSLGTPATPQLMELESNNTQGSISP